MSLSSASSEKWSVSRNNLIYCPVIEQQSKSCSFFLGPDVQRDKLVTGEHIELFANGLGEYWKVLAPYLEMKDSDIRQIESDSEDLKMRAKQLLVTWQDQEGIHATMENLITALNKARLNYLSESLTNDSENSS